MAPGEVREAAVEDARGIAAVHVNAWRMAYRGLLPDSLIDGMSLRRREKSWRELLSGGGPTLTLVEQSEGSIAGFCAIVAPGRDPDLDPHTAEVAAIYVDPSRWRRGTGRRLMEAARRRLAGSGWRRIVLWVLAGNRVGIAFYEAVGYRPDGASRDHRASGLRELRMELDLRAAGRDG